MAVVKVIDLSDLEDQKQDYVDLRMYNAALLELEKDAIPFRKLRFDLNLYVRSHSYTYLALLCAPGRKLSIATRISSFWLNCTAFAQRFRYKKCLGVLLTYFIQLLLFRKC